MHVIRTPTQSDSSRHLLAISSFTTSHSQDLQVALCNFFELFDFPLFLHHVFDSHVTLIGLFLFLLVSGHLSRPDGKSILEGVLVSSVFFYSVAMRACILPLPSLHSDSISAFPSNGTPS